MKYQKSLPFKELRKTRVIGIVNKKGKKYYCDGFVIGQNPSPYGGGYTIVDEDNNLIRHEHVKKINFTNNEGEILGILNALRLAQQGDSISTDSMCCLSWANSGRSKARPDLNIYLTEVKTLLREKSLNLMWEGRNYNLAGLYNETRPRTELLRRPKDSLI